MIAVYQLTDLSTAQAVSDPKNLKFDFVNGTVTVYSGADYVANSANSEPNASKFQSEVINAIGVSKSNSMLQQFPLLIPALLNQDWNNLKIIINLAISAGYATKDAIQSMIDDCNIPIAL